MHAHTHTHTHTHTRTHTHTHTHAHTHTQTHTHTHTQLHLLDRFENQRKPISSNGKIIDEARVGGRGNCDVNERVSSLKNPIECVR